MTIVRMKTRLWRTVPSQSPPLSSSNSLLSMLSMLHKHLRNIWPAESCSLPHYTAPIEARRKLYKERRRKLSHSQKERKRGRKRACMTLRELHAACTPPAGQLDSYKLGFLVAEPYCHSPLLIRCRTDLSTLSRLPLQNLPSYFIRNHCSCPMGELRLSGEVATKGHLLVCGGRRRLQSHRLERGRSWLGVVHARSLATGESRSASWRLERRWFLNGDRGLGVAFWRGGYRERG